MVKGDTLIGIATLSISCPIASLLAEVLISRYRLVGYSLEAMWLLSLTASVVCIYMPRKFTGVTHKNLLYTYLGWLKQLFINPRCACAARVTVVGLCVRPSVRPSVNR